MTQQREKDKHCYCPYCEEELQTSDLAYCQSCNVTLSYCPECKEPVPREQRICSKCGSEVQILS